jgi:hypothetical protein
MKIKLWLPLCVSILSGCAALQAPESTRARDEPHEQTLALSWPGNALRPGADEIRLLDSRVLRELFKPGPYRNAVLLTGAQKKAIIIGSSVVGAYLIANWIEDEVAFFPGP